MKELKYSELKVIYAFAEENDVDQREIVENITEEEEDFEVDDYRFIHEDDIDQIQQDELESDPYILGCFNSWFLSNVTGWPNALIEAAQKGDAYDALGDAIINENKVGILQEEYKSADGYGHHFGHYDGCELEDLIHLGYYAFKIN